MSDDSCVDWDLLNWPGIFKGVVSILLGKFFPTAKAEARMKSCRTSKEEKEEARLLSLFDPNISIRFDRHIF